MSQLMTSIEKSIAFFKRRYPDGHPTQGCLEEKLELLKAREEQRRSAIVAQWLRDGLTCCDKLSTCPFFYSIKDFDAVVGDLRSYVEDYCCGPKRESCFRLSYQGEHDEAAPHHISPTGKEY